MSVATFDFELSFPLALEIFRGFQQLEVSFDVQGSTRTDSGAKFQFFSLGRTLQTLVWVGGFVVPHGGAQGVKTKTVIL